MARRLLWLIVALAVLGAAWMLVDATDPFGSEALERGDGDASDPFLDGDGVAWEEVWDEAPRLVGAPGATRAGSPNAAGAAGGPGGAAAGKGGPGAGGAVVRFGGTVKGTDGHPLKGVTVALRSKGGTLLHAETEANGRFALEIAAGRYDLLFQGEGVGGLSLAAYLVDGATGVDVEFKLKPTWQLSLALKRKGQPVEGAQVSVVPRAGLGGGAVETDAVGVATFPNLVAGSYDMTVAIKAQESVRQRVDLKRDTALKIDVPPGVAIQGTVEGAEDGVRVAEARVTASIKLTSGAWVTAFALTDLNGDYELEVPKGPVGRFTVAADDYAPWPPRKRIKKVLKALRGVGKGKPATMNVALTRGLILAGTVKDPDGKGVQGVDLSLKPRRGPALTTTSGENGAYEVSGVMPGAYDVVIMSEGYFSDRALRVRVPSNLMPGDVHDYDVTVHPTIEVQGQVVHKGKKPAAGARVWITGGGRLLRAAHNAGRELETFTDANGIWRIYDLPPNQGVVARASLGALQARPRGFRTNELPEKLLTLVLTATVNVKGRVLDMTTRRPVPNARVTIRPRGSPGGRTYRTLHSDKEGRFLAEELIPGTWELTPSKAGYLVAKAHEAALEKEDGEVEVELLLDPGLAIGGFVGKPQGHPLKGARLRIWGTSHEGKGVRRYATTGADGRFHLTGFVDGAYTLRASRSGFRNVTVPNLRGGEDRLQINLTPRPPRKP